MPKMILNIRMGTDEANEEMDQDQEEDSQAQRLLARYVLEMMQEQIRLMAEMGYGVEFVKRVNADGSLTDIRLDDMEAQLAGESLSNLAEMAADLDEALIPLREAVAKNDISILAGANSEWEAIKPGHGGASAPDPNPGKGERKLVKRMGPIIRGRGRPN